MRSGVGLSTLGVILTLLSALFVTPLTAQDEEIEALAEQTYLDGDLERAADLYRELAHRVEGERKAEALVTAAWLEYQSGAPGEAGQLLTAALTVDPDHGFRAENYDPPFADLYRDALERARAVRSRQGADEIRRGLAHLTAGELGEARAAFESALDLDSGNPIARYNLALVDRRAGDETAAIAGFEWVVAQHARDPNSVADALLAQSRASLGLLYYERGFLEDARVHLEEAVALDPSDPHAWNNLGLTRRRLGDEPGAAEAFRRAFEAEPESRQALHNAATLAIDRGRWSEAIELLERATEIYPEAPGLWLNLGLARRGTGDVDGALAALERALELDPDSRRGVEADAAAALAAVHYERASYDEAASAAKRSIERDPDDSGSWIYLGLAQQRLGRAGEAKESFERAVSIDPRSAEAHNNLGTSLVSLGDLEGAIAAFEEALALRPEFEAARRNLERVESRLTAGGRGDVAMAGGGASSPPGEVTTLGLTFQNADYSHLGVSGAIVAEVTPESRAAAAGLEAGDIVLTVDGERIASPNAFRSRLGDVTGRATVTLEVLRQGKVERLALPLQ